MTYLDLIRDADRKIDNGDITIGEYEKMIEPLKREIQPERKKGKWINSYKRQTCSVCKQRGYRSWNFCPNCGADMRGDQNED